MSSAEISNSTSRMPATLKTSSTATGPMSSQTSAPARTDAAGLRSRAPATAAVTPGNTAAVAHAVTTKVRSASSSSTPPTSFHTARTPKNGGIHEGSPGNCHGSGDGEGPGDGGGNGIDGIGETGGACGAGWPGGALRMMAPG